METKVCSIFNLKGGVGKTTHTAMFASFLAYGKGKRVLVLDLDSPVPHLVNMRDKDLRLLDRVDSPLSYYLKKNGVPDCFYDVRILDSSIGVTDDLKFFRESGLYDYILVDFPGEFNYNSKVTQVVMEGLVDFIFIPVSVDTMTLNDAELLMRQFVGMDVRFGIFFNMIKARQYDADRDSRLSGRVSPFDIFGSRFRAVNGDAVMFDAKIKNFAMASNDADVYNFVRTTVCWPEDNVLRNCRDVSVLYEEFFKILNG